MPKIILAPRCVHGQRYKSAESIHLLHFFKLQQGSLLNEYSISHFTDPQLMGIYIVFSAFLSSVPFCFVFAAISCCVDSGSLLGCMKGMELRAKAL